MQMHNNLIVDGKNMFVGKNKNKSHMLWNQVYPYGPFMCEKPEWKKCPEHKHLSEVRPDIIMNIQIKFNSEGDIKAEVLKVEMVGSEALTNNESNIDVDIVLDLIEAKNNSLRGDKVYYFKGKKYTTANIMELGVPKERIKLVFTDSGIHFSEKQHEARVEFLLTEVEFLEQVAKIEEKVWQDETLTEKKNFYDVELTRLRYIKDRMLNSFNMITEGLDDLMYPDKRALLNDIPESTIINKANIVWSNLIGKYDHIEIMFRG